MLFRSYDYLQHPIYPLKFDVAGSHTISLIVSDASDHESLPVTKSFIVSESTNDGLAVIFNGPEKMSNYESKSFTIQIDNLK